jgi:hypothetical protein
MDKMWEMLPLIVMFFMVPIIIKLLSDNKTRRKLIEKGLVDEKVKYLFMNKPKEYVSSSLKWGMVLIAIGLAVFVGQLAPKELMEEVTIGAMFVFGGVALVIYYAIASKKISEEHKMQSETETRQ